MRLKRSSSQIVQKRRARPSERPNRLLRMARVLQRKALLTQLPEHHRRLKQLHHLRLQVCVCGSTALSLPVKIDVTLVSGRSGTVVGTKRCRHGRVEWEEG